MTIVWACGSIVYWRLCCLSNWLCRTLFISNSYSGASSIFHVSTKYSVLSKKITPVQIDQMEICFFPALMTTNKIGEFYILCICWVIIWIWNLWIQLKIEIVDEKIHLVFAWIINYILIGIFHGYFVLDQAGECDFAIERFVIETQLILLWNILSASIRLYFIWITKAFFP